LATVRRLILWWVEVDHALNKVGARLPRWLLNGDVFGLKQSSAACFASRRNKSQLFPRELLLLLMVDSDICAIISSQESTFAIYKIHRVRALIYIYTYNQHRPTFQSVQKQVRLI